LDGSIGRDERPSVAARAEAERQYAVLAGDQHFAVRNALVPRAEGRSSGTDDDLANPERQVAATVGILRGEALVLVIVSGEHDIDAMGVHDVPDLLHLIMIAVIAGAESRVVEIGDGAAIGAVHREVVDKPRLLRDVAGAEASQCSRRRLEVERLRP
jgi:hypothetical protein